MIWLEVVLERAEYIFGRLINVCWSLLGWSVLLLIVCAVLGGLVLYERVDEEIRNAVQERLAAALPDYQVTVKSARLVEREGFEVKGITIRYLNASSTEAEMISIAEALVRCRPGIEDLVEGRLKVTHAPRGEVASRAVGGGRLERRAFDFVSYS